MKIRTARADDARSLLQIYAPYVKNTAISFEYDVPTEEEFRRRITDTLTSYPYLVAEENGKQLGYAYASVYHGRRAYMHSVELSVYVDENRHGEGIGRALYTELESLLTRQNVFNLYACITHAEEENDPYVTSGSVLFHEKMGYNLCGDMHCCGYKFGRWYGTVWMEKVIAGRPETPQDFIPFTNLD